MVVKHSVYIKLDIKLYVCRYVCIFYEYCLRRNVNIFSTLPINVDIFVHIFFSIMFCVFKTLHNRSMLLNFHVLYSFGGISSGSVAFLLWNCPSWPLIIFSIGLSAISVEFPREFLIYYFHFLSLSSWLATFSFTFSLLFYFQPFVLLSAFCFTFKVIFFLVT